MRSWRAQPAVQLGFGLGRAQMASFRKDRITDESGLYVLPFTLMQNGYVTTYWHREALDKDAAELRRLGFIVREFDCGSWRDDPAMRR